MSYFALFNIQGMNSESDTLLEDFWEIIKKKFRKYILIGALIIPFAIILVPIFLSVRGKAKRDYHRVKKMLDEKKMQELLILANSNIAEEFGKSVMSTYALVDSKYFPVKETIEFRLVQIKNMSDSKASMTLVKHYEALLEKVEKFEDGESEEIEPLVPNEGVLVEEYWREIRRQSLLLLILSSIFMPILNLILIIPFLISRSKYKRILRFRKEQNETELVKRIRDIRAVFSLTALNQAVMAVCALADLRSDLTLENAKYLLIKLDSGTLENPIRERMRLRKIVMSLEITEKKEDETDESIIEIAKIFFVDAAAIKGEKCMITGLVLDFKNDAVLVCPKCKNYAKQEPMEKWLTEKKICPRCRRKLTITDCPKVMIKENRF